MTITERPIPAESLVAVDFYKNIHKGIRTVLFSATTEAGRIDPEDRAARVAFAAQVDGMVQLLVAHAEGEDQYVQPVLEQYHPALAFEIARAHSSIHERLMTIRAAAQDVVDAPPGEARGRLHHLHLDLALFTAAYLEHEEVEERTVAPALAAAVGLEGLRRIDESIVRSIPPELLPVGLSVMLPAINIDDRAELLSGMRAGAPPEVFAGVWALAQSVLAESDLAALASRLDL